MKRRCGWGTVLHRFNAIRAASGGRGVFYSLSGALLTDWLGLT